MGETHQITTGTESAQVLAIEALKRHYFRLTVRAPRITARATPGQFVNVVCPHENAAARSFDDEADWLQAESTDPKPPLFRRPLGVYRKHDDAFEMIFRVVGRGTRALSQARPGTALDILGPLGHGFDLSCPAGAAVLVAGGSGFAPLYLAAEELLRRGKRVVGFFGMEREMPLPVTIRDERETVTEFEALGVATSIATMHPRDGCHHGFVTDLLERFLRENDDCEVFTCGPWAMLAAVAGLMERRSIRTQVLLEERMGCGIGACMGCACRIRGADGEFHYRRVCTDGPVFEANDVDWTQKGIE